VGSAYIVIYLKVKFYSLNLQSNSDTQLCGNPIESLIDLERKIDSKNIIPGLRKTGKTRSSGSEPPVLLYAYNINWK
jgi:hypothetical protein